MFAVPLEFCADMFSEDEVVAFKVDADVLESSEMLPEVVLLVTLAFVRFVELLAPGETDGVDAFAALAFASLFA